MHYATATPLKLDVDICKVVIDLASLCLAQLASVSFHSSVVTDLNCLLLVCLEIAIYLIYIFVVPLLVVSCE